MSTEQNEHSARLARALVALEKMQARLEASEREKREPIAIIGMACRLPGGGNDPASYWQLLREGRDVVTEIPSDRWDVDAYYDPDPDAAGKMYTKWGGFLQGTRLDSLDAGFFGIAPREVASMDPQQRLMLEVTWEALANAGQAPERIENSLTGVFVGIMLNDYGQLMAQRVDPSLLDAYVALGTDPSFLVGRISYLLGAQGPSVAVNTACSSSLVSVHLACQSLRARESNLAIAGGVNVILSPDGHIVSSRLRSQSPQGRCKTFDASADGYVRGEGCGVLVLKRLSEALADGDPVLAVIRGGAVNHDGPSGGLTVPSGPAQEAVIRRALANAGVEPSQVSYIEAHGTATPLGDPIEVRALQRVFEPGRSRAQPLTLGSVKTNLGHLEAAAGAAGLIKVVLMLQHRQIPPHLHLKEPTKAIPWAELPLTIPTELRDWAGVPGKRVAGISSFGLSGINAHLVIEEAPARTLTRPSSAPPAYLLPLSARGEPALRELARAYQSFLAEDGAGAPYALEDICFTASTRRGQFPNRLTVAGRSRQALVEHLGAFLRDEPHDAISHGEAATRRPKVVFVFSGQGSQWPAMGRRLMRESPVFRATLEACDQAMRAYVDWSLMEQLQADEATSRMSEIDVLQPTLFAIAVALAAHWRSWGIEPDAVVGHSMGEVAAAYVAGVLSLDDAARVICRRSILLRRVRGQGGMALAEISLAEARAALVGYEDRLSVAASNGPTTTVLAGEPNALREVTEGLRRRNVFCRDVKVDVASHSPQVEPLLAELREQLEGLRPEAARLTVYSTVTGSQTDGKDWDASYWVRNLRQPVLFSTAIEQLLASPHHLFLEISPHPVLSQSIERMCAAYPKAQVLPSLLRDEVEGEILLRSLGALYTAGHPIDWRPHYAGPHACVPLPAYPWQRSRYWVELQRAEPRAGLSAPPPSEESAEVPAASLHGEGTASRFYDDSAELERVLQPDEVYLTFGIMRRPVPGFSWLLNVYGMSETPEHKDVLLDGQRGLRSVLFGGVRWESVRKVLDFGCGYASDLLSLARRHPHLKLHGYTISAEQAAVDARRVRERGFEDRIRVFARDSAKDAFPDRYDVAFGFEVATHIADKDALFSNLARSLNNGGFLLLADFIAAGVSAINIEETASYNSSAEEWADVLSRHNFRLVEGVDISREASLFLEDPSFDQNLERVTERFKLNELVRRNFDAMRNFGKALEKGLMSYALLIIQKDEYASPSYLARVNQAKLGALTPYAEFENGGADWAEPAGQDTARAALTAPRDWFYDVSWPHKARGPGQREASRTSAASSAWLILSDRSGVGQALAERLRAKGEPCTLLHANEEKRFEQVAQGAWRGVVHLWTLDGGSLSEVLATGCESLPSLVQGLGQSSSPGARLWLVTRGAQAVGKDIPSVTLAPLWGAGRVLALEHPELWGGLLDLPSEWNASQVDALCEELLHSDGEDQIAYRAGSRHVARLVRAAPAATGPVAWRADGVYLITGGLGGLGLQVARWLVSRGARHLVLVGRTGLPEASQWDALSADSAAGRQVRAVRELESQGASVKVVRCDVGESQQVAALVGELRAGPLPLRGIFHAAGVSVHRPLVETDAALMASVFHSKVKGAQALHESTRDLPLDCFVLFSSASSVWGAQGMAAYAAANHFLEAFAGYRHAQGLVATCVNWGQWSEGGMAGSEEALRFFASVGLEAMPTASALAAMDQLVGSGAIRRTVASVDWNRFKPIHEAKRRRPLLDDIQSGRAVAASKAPERDTRSELLRQLEEAPSGRRRGVLLEHVRQVAARVLGAEPSALAPHQGFFQMGMNSLMSVELKNHLEKSFRHKLPSTLVFEYPTVDELTNFLAKELPAFAALIPAHVAPPSIPIAAPEDSAPVDDAILELLGEAQRLSETELHSLAQSLSGDGSK
uniref:MelE protein n=1 Tax=Melittangium lichenicola TaxID=45 RepID=Q70P95_9BACT|nr:MelE protein [Melittangium lichenicola]